MSLIETFFGRIYVANITGRDPKDIFIKNDICAFQHMSFNIDKKESVSNNAYSGFHINHLENDKCKKDAYILDHIKRKVTHFECISDAAKKKYERILIIDDNAILTDDIDKHFYPFANVLLKDNPNWDMIYFGGEHLCDNVTVGAYAYAVSNRMYEYLMNGIANCSEELDYFYIKQVQKNKNVLRIGPLASRIPSSVTNEETYEIQNYIISERDSNVDQKLDSVLPKVRKYNRAVYTIITPDHLHHAITLYDSMMQFCPNIEFNVFATESISDVNLEKVKKNTDVIVHNIHDINAPMVRRMIARYENVNKDALRWSLKPSLMHYLIPNYNKVLYCDSDLFFVNNFEFLFDLLNDNKIILTPHWRKYPNGNDTALFADGVYNAGFFGCSKGCEKAMQWWDECCHFACIKSREAGLFVDQKYLDAFPYMFNAHSIQHRGCNLAYWNDKFLTKEKRGDKIFADGYPAVFFHQTFTTVDLMGGILSPRQEYMLKIEHNRKIYSL